MTHIQASVIRVRDWIPQLASILSGLEQAMFIADVDGSRYLGGVGCLLWSTGCP